MGIGSNTLQNVEYLILDLFCDSSISMNYISFRGNIISNSFVVINQ